MGQRNGNNRGAGNPNGFGGKYVRKAENLTAKQLKAAGAAKAAKKRTVSISDTKRAYGKGITLGPGGKPLTGSVRLENGNMAVYKDGKRVTTAPKSKAKPASSGGGRSTSSTSSSSTTTRNTSTGNGGGNKKPPKVGEVRLGTHGRKNRWDGKKWVRVETAGSGYQAGAGSSASSSAAAKAAAAKRAAEAARASGQVPTASRSYSNGASNRRPAPGRQYEPIAVSGPTATPQRDPGAIPGVSGSKPVREQTREVRRGSSIVTEVKRNGKWVTKSTRAA